MSKLSHLDDKGRASMVDVSTKESTERLATAEAVIVLSEEAYNLVMTGKAKKGDVLATARIAGIMGAKKTSELIPLCHPLALTHAGVDFEPLAERHAIRILASAKTAGQTGVEMEALTAASIAALTVYDMIKAVDKSAVIESIRLLTKSGGKSGEYKASNESPPPPRRSRGSTPPPQAGEENDRTNASFPPPLAGEVARRAGGGKASPRVLIHEAAAPKLTTPSADRDALRAFMTERRLKPTEWAKSAGVPLGELYGFLSGRARSLPEETAVRLAKAARVQPPELFGRKGQR